MEGTGMRTVKTENGTMWEDRLQDTYATYAEFEAYDAIYGIARRLGFEGPQEAWRKNPLVQGSVNPGDLRVVEGEKGA